MYRIGPHFLSYSRRGNRRIVDSITVDATRKMDEKTTKMVFHWTETAYEHLEKFKVPVRNKDAPPALKHAGA